MAVAKQAGEIASSLRLVEDSYSYHTMAKINLKKLQLLIEADEDFALSALESAAKDVERSLSEGLQQFPGDPYLLDSEANLAGFLSDSKRVLEALKKAFEANTRSPFIATRLSQCYRSQNDMSSAKGVLEKALGSSPNEKKLHYLYGKLLFESAGNTEDIIYHLRRSFVPGDNNHDAQLLYARQLFGGGLRTESKNAFAELGKARVATEASVVSKK